MRTRNVAVLGLLLALAACETATVAGPGGGGTGHEPAPPRDLQGWYYAHVVNLSWELDPRWDGEAFRVYGKRRSDADFFLIAEVTSCGGSVCTYRDLNVLSGVTYEYYVSAVSPSGGVETPSSHRVEVFVPQPTPPPVPRGLEVVALDEAVFLKWDARAREADDFSFYRLYLIDSGGSPLLLGETDSEGFLDLLVANGERYTYAVAAVDDQGHESARSDVATGTPRPDFRGELVYSHQDRPELSGFRFPVSEEEDPRVDGDAPERDFRIETDADGWWLVPGPGAAVHAEPVFTTALRCGPAADAGCTDVAVAPASGYTTQDMPLDTEFSYVLRVPGDGGSVHYGVIRVTTLGFDQEGDALAIFDWAFQLVPDERSLEPEGGEVPVAR